VAPPKLLVDPLARAFETSLAKEEAMVLALLLTTALPDVSYAAHYRERAL
jgi:hypothetical protein